jgi:hypothetical protein
VRRRYPHEALVFDTETLPGPAQNLRILVWRLYRDPPDGAPGSTCIEEGIAYRDQLEHVDPRELALLREYVANTEANVAPGFPARLCLEPLAWWLEERLHSYGYQHRDRCDIVGFNLLFDLGRLARYWAPGQRRNAGGYSLGFVGEFDENGKWKDQRFHARLQIRAIDPRRSLISWSTRTKNDPDPARGRGRFVDLRTLTFALTDRPHTLETACAAFGDPYEKAEVDYATLTPELLGYALDDVRHTGLLYGHCLEELARHEGVNLEPHRLYSPATVGTRYLEAMGVGKPLVKFTNLTSRELGWDMGSERFTIPPDEPRGELDPRLLGWSMSAFYGGRAEARIVRTPVPVTLVDFTSMYPSVNTLLGTWALLRAEALTTTDATEQVRALLNAPNLVERCLTPTLWEEIGVTLVELEPDRDVLPVRAVYDPTSADYGIGVNPLSYNGRLWYTLPDVLAAAILNPTVEGAGGPPRVIRAIQLVRTGDQADLRPVQLRGGDLIDPAATDPFVRLIEQRQRVLRDRSLDPAERARLERFLKITANATAYGVLARFDRRHPDTHARLTIYGPDEASSELRPSPRGPRSLSPEDPGPFCFPPIAATITAGARLMLALLERLVHDAGGNYAFCDTDSMAIVATLPGDTIPCNTADGTNTIQALPWPTVERILERFHNLNPYDPKLVPSPWKVEANSLTDPLYCYAISAKRYCLYRPNQRGRAEIVAAIDGADDTDQEHPADVTEALEDWSEHGLGLYLDPTSPDSDRPRRDKRGRRLWVAEAWQWILDDAHARNPRLPRWADTYALTRFTVSSPTIERWFSGHNASRLRSDWIRPGSFGLLAHPTTIGLGAPLPAAPYETDPAAWPTLDWYDRRTGRPIRVTTIQGDDPELRAHELLHAVPIALIADILTRYRRRAERKSLAPDGGRPAGQETRGLLQRRPVVSSPPQTELTGKEGNKLDERHSGEVTQPSEYRSDYGRRASTWPMVVAILQELGAPEIAWQTSISRSAVYDVMRGAQPRSEHAREYETIALRFASERFLNWGLDPPAHPIERLKRYLAEREARGEDIRRCEWDGKPIPPGRRSDARFCSNRCRRAASRGLRAPLDE